MKWQTEGRRGEVRTPNTLERRGRRRAERDPEQRAGVGVDWEGRVGHLSGWIIWFWQQLLHSPILPLLKRRDGADYTHTGHHTPPPSLSLFFWWSRRNDANEFLDQKNENSHHLFTLMSLQTLAYVESKREVQQNVRAALFRVLNMNADKMQSISKNDKSLNKLWSIEVNLKAFCEKKTWCGIINVKPTVTYITMCHV